MSTISNKSKRRLWWLPLDTVDYVMRVMQWPVPVRALYIDLCAIQWNDESLPEDPEELRRICRFNKVEFLSAWKRVEPLFPIQADGRRRNPDVEAERRRAEEVSRNKVRKPRDNVIPLNETSTPKDAQR